VTAAAAKTPAQRGLASRRKGQRGEREVCRILHELTGRTIKRRVRQHDGDSDLEGLPDWSVEVKNCARVTPGLLSGWWKQAAAQARAVNRLPLLFFKHGREWQCAWPAALHYQGGNLANTVHWHEALVSHPLTWRAMCKPLIYTDRPDCPKPYQENQP